MILFQNKGCLKNFVLGAFFMLAGISLIIFDPLSMVIKDQFRIAPGKYLYNLFTKPHIEIYYNVYVYNITNPAEFLSGVDKKLKMKEVGPYVFREIQENKNTSMNANGTFSYVIHKTHIPVPERSIGDTKTDIIFAPNTILLGASSVAARHSKFAAVGFKVLANSLDSQPILNMSVQNYLWGYEDKLVKLASNVLPSITFNKFGVLDRMFDEGNDLVTIHLPQSDLLSNKKELIAEKLEKAPSTPAPKVSDVEYEEETDYEEVAEHSEDFIEDKIEISDEVADKSRTARPFSIDYYNGGTYLPHFEYFENHRDEKLRNCAKVQGGFEGTLFFKNVTQREVMKIYRRTFCRSLPIYFSNATKIFGLDAFYFELSENAFYDRYDDPDTCCFCQDENSCLKKGLGNISPCYFGIPLAVSQPHFYNGDPSLLDEVDGLSPEKGKHETVLAIQPQLGVPMRVYLRMQLNLVTGDLSSNQKIEKFGNKVLPIIWAECELNRLPKDVEILLKASFIVLPYVQTILAVVLVICGLAFVILSLVPRKKLTRIEKSSTVQPLLIQKQVA